MNNLTEVEKGVVIFLLGLCAGMLFCVGQIFKLI